MRVVTQKCVGVAGSRLGVVARDAEPEVGVESVEVAGDELRRSEHARLELRDRNHSERRRVRLLRAARGDLRTHTFDEARSQRGESVFEIRSESLASLRRRGAAKWDGRERGVHAPFPLGEPTKKKKAVFFEDKACVKHHSIEARGLSRRVRVGDLPRTHRIDMCVSFSRVRNYGTFHVSSIRVRYDTFHTATRRRVYVGSPAHTHTLHRVRALETRRARARPCLETRSPNTSRI